MRVLHRHFFDLLDSRGDSLPGASNDAVVIGVLSAIAAVLVIVLAMVLLVVRKRKKGYQRLWK